MCCSHGTLLHFGLQSSRLNICYYHQDLHPGSRPRLLCSPQRPSYSSRHFSHLMFWVRFLFDGCHQLLKHNCVLRLAPIDICINLYIQIENVSLRNLLARYGFDVIQCKRPVVSSQTWCFHIYLICSVYHIIGHAILLYFVYRRVANFISIPTQNWVMMWRLLGWNLVICDNCVIYMYLLFPHRFML